MAGGICACAFEEGQSPISPEGGLYGHAVTGRGDHQGGAITVREKRRARRWRRVEGSVQDRPRDHDGSREIILVGPTFHFFLGSKYGKLLEMKSFLPSYIYLRSWQTTIF